jgi:hypothetical protein
MRKLVITATVLGAVLGVSAAQAVNVNVTSTGLQLAAPSGPGQLIDFENGAPAGFTVSGGNYAYLNDSSGNGAEPAGDTSTYLSVMGGGHYTMLGTTAYNAVSLYWGSIDTYNYLDLLGANGNVIATITSNTMQNGNWANGSWTDGETNRRVNITSDVAFYGLGFRSDSNSFEADNIKFQGAVPEPASWAMMVGGFGVLGSALRRRRKSALSIA